MEKEHIEGAGPVRLTKYAAKGGCACKIGPHILAEALAGFKGISDPRVLVDMEGSDDAGIFQISQDFALVQTMDFFTPMVDDPYTFGQIAAANSLSDVYAMGGQPLTAMNIVAFPVPLVESGVLRQVLEGAKSVLAQAGVALMGGHSVENEVPLFGLSVTGQVSPKALWKNAGAQAGDVLVLTKALGTGVMTTALKGGLFEEGGREAIASMCTLNQKASQVARTFTVHACTDVTGFSLMGHSLEMAKGSQVSLHMESQALPLFEDTLEAAQMGLVPAATYGNRKALLTNDGAIHLDDKLAPVWSDIAFDPQTSGGLLLAVPGDEADALVEALKAEGLDKASIIGRVEDYDGHYVYLA